MSPSVWTSFLPIIKKKKNNKVIRTKRRREKCDASVKEVRRVMGSQG